MSFLKIYAMVISLMSLSPVVIYAELVTTAPTNLVVESPTIEENEILCYFTADGKIIDHKDGSKYYRKILKINPDNSYIIQDFYSTSDKKQIDPTTFKYIVNLKAWDMDKIGVLEGHYTQWYENGRKETELTSLNGKKQGPSVEWYENGQKRSELTFKEGKIDGVVKMWQENGQLKMEAHYKNGELNGLFNIRSTPSTKEDVYYFNDDKKIGKAEHQEKANQGEILLTMHFIHDKPEGPITITDVATGKKIEEGYYKEGLLEGVYTHWYTNGKKSSELHYKADKKDGIALRWYENGQKKEHAVFKNNLIEGVYKTWYKNGQIRSECLIKEGIEQLPCKKWDKQGNDLTKLN